MSTFAYRKCVKCGASAAKDETVRIHRFPKLGTTNILRAMAWATYCWPDQDWSSLKSLSSLYKKGKHLCGAHFLDSCYTDNCKMRLSRYAVPGTKEYVVKTMQSLRSKISIPSIVQQEMTTLGELAETPPDEREDAFQTIVSTSGKRACNSSPAASDRKRLSTESPRRNPGAPIEGSSDHLFPNGLSQQMQPNNQVLAVQAEQNENINKMFNSQTQQRMIEVEELPLDLDQSYESRPDSTTSDKEEEMFEISNPGPKNSKEEELRAKIADARRELAIVQGKECDEVYDFAPAATEKEPNIVRADSKAVEHGINCQKLGHEGWNKVQYAELQKQFQATPIFSSLKVNNLLDGLSPPCKSAETLERFDMTLGAITHGLIQERIIFQDLLDSLPKEIKDRVGKEFVQANSAFRRKSDALIQYTCGRRAEVIKNRRDMFRPQNATYESILREIPPSETHLFEEKALSDAVKELGGINRLFPRQNKSFTTSKPYSARVLKPTHKDQPGQLRLIAIPVNPIPQKEIERREPADVRYEGAERVYSDAKILIIKSSQHTISFKKRETT